MDPIEMNEWRLDPDAAPVLHVNPKLDPALQPTDNLRNWLENEPRARGHHLFQTSGTTGNADDDKAGGRWVALSTSAVMASATAVNHHLRVGPGDHWLLALPTFHIGGFSMLVRAALAGIALTKTGHRWQPQRFVECIDSAAATLTSLVPTQVSDLVTAGLQAPQSLRTVLVGGGRLDPQLHQRALSLGWPLRRTYGMTETSSQVATESLDIRPSSLGNAWLPLLPSWEVRLAEPDNGPISASQDEPIRQLELRGPALFSGYVQTDDRRQWCWIDPMIDGWWRCPDLVQMRMQASPEAGPELLWQGRCDRVVKILGELVALDSVESRLRSLADPAWRERLAVISMAEVRNGRRIVLVSDQSLILSDLRSLVEAVNPMLAPFGRIGAIWRVDELPRTSLGKLRHAELEQQLDGAMERHSDGHLTALQPLALEVIAGKPDGVPVAQADFA